MFFLQISDNGYITFHVPLLTNIPTTFPIGKGRSHVSQIAKMIAPYWSDIDTRCGGDVWYRTETLDASKNLYWRIIIEVANSGAVYNFVPTSALIVTWEGVTCQNDVPCTDQRVSLVCVVQSLHTVIFSIFAIHLTIYAIT